MYILTWSSELNEGTIGTLSEIHRILVKPELNFNFTNLYYEEAHGRAIKDGQPLTAQEIEIVILACETYLANIIVQQEDPTTAPTKTREELLSDAAKIFLARTDWWVVRGTELGIPVPESLEIRRSEARTYVITNENVLTLRTLLESNIPIEDFLLEAATIFKQR